MDHPKIYITGLGFSGTTFVTNIARALSLDIGSNLTGREGEENIKGLEWTPFREIAVSVGLWMGRKMEPERPRWTSILLENISRVKTELSHKFEELDYPTVVKCPEYGQSFFLDVIKPDRIILCYRDVIHTAVSFKRSHNDAFVNLTLQDIHVALFEQLGSLMANIFKYKIPYTILEFPRDVDDGEYMWNQVGHLMTEDKDFFLEAHKKISDSSLVHVK